MIKEYGISVTTRIIVDDKAHSCHLTRETPKRDKSYASSIVFMWIFQFLYVYLYTYRSWDSVLSIVTGLQVGHLRDQLIPVR